MSKLPKILAFIIFILVVYGKPVIAQAAPRIFADPASVTVSQNNEFTIQIKIDAESNQVIGSDTTVSYAGADLDIVSVTNGGYFPEFDSANNGNSGRLEIHGYVTSTYQSKTGAGTLATIVFKSKKSAGSSSISFTCVGSGNDTNIIDVGGQNLLSCGQTNQVSVSYNSGSSITNTPTPTTGSQGSTNVTPTCASLVSNITTATGAPQAVTFTCSGVDPSGLIMAAEFVFGDGTKQLVERNAGSPGSIATTHTYTTIGTLGATCRVRDNDNVFSSIPESCRKIITIYPRPTNTPTPIRIATLSTTNLNTQSTPIVTPTPTVAVVSIISDTPFPTFAPEPTTEPLYGETEQPASRRPWWAIGGIIALFAAYLLLRRKKKPPTPPPMPPIIVQEMPPAHP